MRIRDFRNICAHDERLYCARPHNKNATLFQVIKDLRLVTDKQRYVDFLEQIDTLLQGICDRLPLSSQGILNAMGFNNIDEFIQLGLDTLES